MKKKNIKKILHQKNQTKYQNKIDQWLHNVKPVNSVKSLIYQYPYHAEIDSLTLNKNYDEYIQPLIDAIKQNPFEYNPRDNRTIMWELHDTKEPDLFNGLVMNHKIVIKNHQIKIYLLIGDVNMYQKQHYRTVTDHLWIDINDFQSAFPKNETNITIGIGDFIHFSGTVHQYRGYREGIRQTKYGIQDVCILDSGYPNIINNQYHKGSRFEMGSYIPYQHQNHFIIKYYNYQNYTMSCPVFGDQMDIECRNQYHNPVYKIGNSEIKSIKPIIESGLKLEQPNDLILNTDEETLIWASNYDSKNPNIKKIGNTKHLKQAGLESYYQLILKQNKWRY